MSRPSGMVVFPRSGKSADPLLPRTLTSTHKERHVKKLLESRARAERRANRRVEFEARQLIVREQLAKEKGRRRVKPADPS